MLLMKPLTAQGGSAFSFPHPVSYESKIDRQGSRRDSRPRLSASVARSFHVNHEQTMNNRSLLRKRIALRHIPCGEPFLKPVHPLL
jgi:hypothetical protein